MLIDYTCLVYKLYDRVTKYHSVSRRYQLVQLSLTAAFVVTRFGQLISTFHYELYR